MSISSAIDIRGFLLAQPRLGAAAHRSDADALLRHVYLQPRNIRHNTICRASSAGSAAATKVRWSIGCGLGYMTTSLHALLIQHPTSLPFFIDNAHN